MKTLADCIGGRDNNFNLIRFVAAAAVLLTHSYAVVGIDPNMEPMRHMTGKSFGGMAVDAFFIISGFLVTGSLLSRKSAIQFLAARVLRIYPALAMVNILTVFVLGLWLTTFSWHEYLGNSFIYEYLIKNTLLFFGIAYYLPGLFESHVIKGGVNGSLWTMYYEVRMYAILLLTWVILALITNRSRDRKVSKVLAVVAAGAVCTHVFNHYTGVDEHASRLYFMFFSGVLYYLLRARIVLSGHVFLAALGLFIFGVFFRPAFFLSYHLLLPYIVLYLAYIPDGWVRRYNRLGDYSYGFYIYAFPIQQTVVALNPGVSLAGMLASAFPVTLFFAVLSWHFVEKKALSRSARWKQPSARRLEDAGRAGGSELRGGTGAVPGRGE